MDSSWFFVQVDDEYTRGDDDLRFIVREMLPFLRDLDKGTAECVRLVDDATGEILFEQHSNGNAYGRPLEELQSMVDGWEEF